MECKFCGTENIDEAVYCKECGRRVDGNVKCPHCGEIVPADGKFCIKCGGSLIKPAKPEPTFERAVSEVAVTSASAEVASGSVASYNVVGNTSNAGTSNATATKTFDARRIVTLFGNAMLVLSALMSLIFVFFVGVKVASSSSSYSSDEQVKLFDYFGKVYKNADVWSDAGGVYGRYSFTQAIVGTIVCALGLLFVVCSALMTMYRMYQQFYKKQQTNWVSFATATFISYALFATLYLVCHVVGWEYSSISVYMTYNGATLAGIIIAAICFGLSVLCRLGLYIKDNADKKVRVEAGVSVLALICGIVAISLIVLPAVIISYSGMKISSGFLRIYYLVYSELGASTSTEKLDGLYLSTTFGVIFTICLCLCIGRLLCVCLAGEEKSDNRFNLNLGLLVLLAIGDLVCAVVAGNQIVNLFNTTSLTASFVSSIVILVLILLMAVLFALRSKIASAILGATNHQTQEQVNNQQ